MSSTMPAKQPQDHMKAAKAEAKDEPLVIPFNGVDYSLSPDVFNDVEILEVIGDMQDNPVLLPKAVRGLLGDKQWAQFKDSNRDAAGRVHVERLSEFFAEVDGLAGNLAAS